MKHQLIARTASAQRASGEVRGPRQENLAAEPVADRVVSLRLLRFPAIRERTGLSRSTIWRLERRGAFPKHRRISPNAVAWVEDEVNVWIRERVESS